MQPKHDIRPDEGVLSAWREGLAEASKMQDVKQQLLQNEGELLPRFAEHYAKLKHLPRRMRRSLQRQWRKSLAGIALLFALGATPALAATINVGGACTLERAIVAANNDTTAFGQCAKGSGADRIVLPRNSTVTLTGVNNSTYGATGLPIVRSVITIDGNGSTIRRAPSAGKFRILAVAGFQSELTLQETTVSGGVAAGFGGIEFSGVGGGLLNTDYGKLTLSNCTVSGNRARAGGGLANGRYVSTTTLTNSTISGNSAAFGGGVYNFGLGGRPSSLYITNSTISGNRAAKDGGGVVSDYYAFATITSSTISGNVAGGSGGGVLNVDEASAGLTNSTVSGNRAGKDGGGVFNGGSSSVSLTHSTVTGNTAVRRGGGVADGSGGLYNSYIHLVRSLISGNTAASGREIFHNTYRTTITAADFNVFGQKGETKAQALVGFTPSGTDITATSNGNRPTALNRILNTTLAKNGGRTRTHALVAGSPAVDAVNDGTCPPPARDQRGVRRPRDGNGDGGPACDVGSFER